MRRRRRSLAAPEGRSQWDLLRTVRLVRPTLVPGQRLKGEPKIVEKIERPHAQVIAGFKDLLPV
jgi:hypothetical protein